MVGECLVLDESRTNVDDPRDDEKRIDDIYRRAPKTDAIRVDPRRAACSLAEAALERGHARAGSG